MFSATDVPRTSPAMLVRKKQMSRYQGAPIGGTAREGRLYVGERCDEVTPNHSPIHVRRADRDAII